MIRRAAALFLIGAGVLGQATAVTAAEADDLPIVVLDVRKPADQRLVDWIDETLHTTAAHVFILQVDAPGMSSGDPDDLFRAVADPALSAPVVVWVGPNPAVAHGAMACLLAVADRSAAAPGTVVGYVEPTVVKGEAVPCPSGGALDPLASDTMEVAAPVPGVIDDVVATVGQLIVGLDGVTITRPGGEVVTLETAATEVGEDGTEVVVASRPVEFRKPGLFDRFLRLAARPEAAWFFLVAGIAIATFEFYAAGIGVTAAVAALSLFLAGYGMATLPIDPIAVAATFAGLSLYTWDFQRARIGWRSLVGTALLLWGGLTFTDADPQFGPVWWIVVGSVLGAALFYGFALTTIARSRFSTRTIGRGQLIGKTGVAETDLAPEGVVVIDGARWRGRSHREAGITVGDPVAVTGVSGIVLEVEPGVRD